MTHIPIQKILNVLFLFFNCLTYDSCTIKFNLGSIPGSGKSPGEVNGNTIQYSCLENPIHRGAWQATVHWVSRVGHDLTTNPPSQVYNPEGFIIISYTNIIIGNYVTPETFLCSEEILHKLAIIPQSCTFWEPLINFCLYTFPILDYFI